MKYELTTLNIRGSEFTAKFGDEEHSNYIRISRERRYGQPVGNVRIGWCSTTDETAGAMKMARTLMAATQVAMTLDKRLELGMPDGVELALSAQGFDVDSALRG